MDEHRKRVLQFFDNEIKLCVIGDLERLAGLRPIPPHDSQGCTIPQAMVLFAILDLFGYLLNPSAKAKKTETFESSCDKLVMLFRHGIMHQFFPKASGIAKMKSGEKAPLISEVDGTPTLNIDRMTEDVVTALKELRDRVESDEDLAERINQRLDKLATEDYDTLCRITTG